MKNELTPEERKAIHKCTAFEHSCAICGKSFTCTGEYVYKRSPSNGKASVYFCSWTCYRKDEAERDKKRIYNRRVV